MNGKWLNLKRKASRTKGDLGEGNLAPDFVLPDQNGNTVRLSEMLSKGRKLVLYFYVRDDTPGCTKEACALRDGLDEIRSAGGLVLGISPDTPTSHQKFAVKHKLTFPILADVGAKVAKAYGVYKLKNLYGRKYFGVERSTFIINPDGGIGRAFRRVKVDGHLKQILEAIH